MVAVDSKSIPEKQNISLGVSKNSDDNLENGLFSEIFSSESLDANRVEPLSSDHIETNETIIKQETQVETSFVNNEDSQNDINDIEVDQKLNENIEFQSTDHNHMVLSKSSTSIDEALKSDLDEIDFETGVSAELKINIDDNLIVDDSNILQSVYVGYKLNSNLDKDIEKETEPGSERDISDQHQGLYVNSLHINKFTEKTKDQKNDGNLDHSNKKILPNTSNTNTNLLKNDPEKINVNYLTEETIIVKTVNKDKNLNYDEDNLSNIKINKEDYSKLNKNDNVIDNKLNNIKNVMQNNVDSNTNKFFETKYINSSNTYTPQSKNSILNNQTNLTNSSFEFNNLNFSNNFSGGSSNQQNGTQSQSNINNFQMLNDIKENLDMSDRRWTSNLASRLNKAHSSNINEVELVLTPKNLGRMKIKISLSDKTAYVKITTDSAAASTLIQDEQDKLNEMLKEVGLELEDFSSNQSSQQKFDDDKSQSRKDSNKTLVDLKDNDKNEEEHYIKDESLLNIKV